MKALYHPFIHCAWYFKIDQHHEGLHEDAECEMDPNRTYSRKRNKILSRFLRNNQSNGQY